MKLYRQDDATEIGKNLKQTGQRKMLVLTNKNIKLDKEEKVRLMKEKQKFGIE